MKYGNWTLGQVEALINTIGEDPALAILRGEKIVKVEKAIFKFFDKNGRRVPQKGLQNNVCDPNKDFYLVQPELKKVRDYADRLIRFQEAFHPGPMFLGDFERKAKELLSELRVNKLLANLLNGIYLPIILPKLENFSDYGKTLEQTFLSAIQASHQKQFPNESFYNREKNELAGEVSIIPGTRHEKLIEKMKQGIVYAIYFPNPLQGFSPLASREQMQDLPESLILVGGFDASAAQVMYPDILSRDFETPGYDLSALQYQSSNYSFYFDATGGAFELGSNGSLALTYGSYSSSLLFLGST